MQYYSCKEIWNAIILNLWSLTKHVLYFSFFFFAAANYSKVSSCGEGRPRKWWIWQGKNVNFDELGFFVIYFLELINNLWSLKEGNYELDSVWISAPLRSHRFWLFYFSVFFLVLVSINRENISNTLDSVSKPRNSSKIRRFTLYFQLSSRCLEMWSTRSFLFDLLQRKPWQLKTSVIIALDKFKLNVYKNLLTT